MSNKKHSWFPLFGANFLGVFNDYFLKSLVCFVSILWLSERQDEFIVSLASAMLVIPYLIFSPVSGKMAKAMEKRLIVIYVKLAEIPIMIIASIGFILESVPLVMAGIFLMGLQSVMYSPAKYGLIRDIRGQEGISFGTGAMEMLTFLAVLLGTFFATLASDHYNIYVVCAVMIVIAIAGWLVSLPLKANESQPEKSKDDPLNPITFWIHSFRLAKKYPGLNIVILGIASFWLIGSLVHMTLIVHCPNALKMTNTQTGIIMSVVAIGIGLGCFLTGIISNKKVALGLVPIGGIGLTLNLGLIYFLDATGIGFSVLIFFAAFFSGFFKIPLNAWIQENVKGRVLGKMLAYNNLNVFIFLLLSSGVFWVITHYVNTDAVFLFLFVNALVLTGIVMLFIPGMFKQFKGYFHKE